MDFSKLNPWRKTPTLYNWDNNYRIEIEELSLTSTPLLYEWICPDKYYAIITYLIATFTHGGGFSTTQFVLETHRGSKRSFYFKTPSTSQYVSGAVISFAPLNYYQGTVISKLNQPTPFPIYLYPGDRFTVAVGVGYTTPAIEDTSLVLKAYYL